MIKLPKETIDQLVKDSKGDHFEYVIQLYFMVPGFREANSVEGYPQLNKKTAEYILKAFHDFYPTNDAWGLNSLWLNKGMAYADDPNEVNEWIIDTSKFKVFKLEKV